MAGTLKTGMTGLHLQKITENFSAIKIKDRCRRQRVVCYKEYSPELLKEEKRPYFWRFSTLMLLRNPNEGVNGLYFNAIHDGRVLDEATGKLADVRDDQVVSRWDLDTGPTSMLECLM
jgi:hypothetical protein